MTQKFFKLIVLVSYILPMQIYAEISFDLADISDETNAVRKPFNSLQVAGPLAVTGLASLAALNVKNGADFGGDVAIDGNLYVDGGIVLDSCLVLTCTSAGTLLVNGQPITAGGGGGGSSCDLTPVVAEIESITTYTVNANFVATFTALAALGACDAIPLTASTGYTITTTGYYCLAGDITGPITINSSDVTLDLNSHTITLAAIQTGVTVSSGNSDVIIKNGNIYTPSGVNGTTGIALHGVAATSDSNFYMYDVKIDGAKFGINTSSGVTNLDIARVTVTRSGTAGFNISDASNVTLSECSANIGGGNGFQITGVATGLAGPSVALNSCVAAGNASGGGFDITGYNVTLTNCVAQGNQSGFVLGTTATDIMLENCIGNFNSLDGFTSQANGPCSFISSIAQNNTQYGIDVSGSTNKSTSQGSGLIKACVAEGNGCGFVDALSGSGSPAAPASLYRYVANVAQGNGGSNAANPGGDTNYCLYSFTVPGGIEGSTFTIPGPGPAPYFQFIPNNSGTMPPFVPTYWNNITLPV